MQSVTYLKLKAIFANVGPELQYRSTVNKRLNLQTLVAIGKLDVMAITETWLNDSINDLEILLSTYTVRRKDR